MQMREPSKWAQNTFFLIVFIFVLYLVYLLATPLLNPLLFGAILAGTVNPLNQYLKRKLKYSDETIAIITSLITTVVIIIPCVYIAIRISQEAFGLYDRIKDFVESDRLINLYQSENFIVVWIKKFFTTFSIDPAWESIKEKVLEYGQSFTGSILKIFNKVLGNVLHFLFDFIIMSLTLYAFMAYGKQLKNFMFNLSPLSDSDEELLLERFNTMNYVSLVCNGVGGVIQGGLAGLLFFVLGLDSPFLWTAVMVLLAFIPLLGISVVTIPASAFLMLSGQVGTGIFLLVSTLVIAFVVENWFKPKFIGDRIKINSLFVLFTIIGGMNVFGIAGIFYGPLIGILFLTMVSIYHEKYTIQIQS